ncbi:MAG: hypothetical protein AAF481_02445 [Acidobacteriota bacterium]
MAFEQAREPDRDRLIIEGLLAGDPSSVQRIRGWIRLTAGRYRRFLVNDLEDLEQEILTSLLVNLSSEGFRFASRLETYVSRMVHYKCIDRMRAGSRREWVDVADFQFPTDGRSALESLQRRQSVEQALRVADSLSQACRKLWAMVREGLSYSEMARRTGVAPGTLRVRVLRCRRQAVETREKLLANEAKWTRNG